MDEKLWRVKNLTNEDVDVPWAEEAMDVAWAVETVMMAVSLPVAFTRSTLERKNSNNKNSTNRSHRPPSRLARCLPEDSQAYLEELRKRWHQHGDSTRLIELKTNLFALDMLKGYLQSQLDNLLFPYKKN